MGSKVAIAAVDEGTTGTRALLIDQEGRTQAQAYRALGIHYPQPGWVEQDPMEIWAQTQAVLGDVVRAAGEQSYQLLGIAITNQRETAIVWDRRTGAPLHPAIVWQCRRTALRCAALKEQGVEPVILDRTGLPVDPYFSATKMAWMLDSIQDGRALAAQGCLCLGTVDSWLLWHLTGGRVHATDVTNASRTQLMDLERRVWDEEMAGLVEVPLSALPEIVPSSGEVGRTHGVVGVPDGLPILSMIGDSQAALFGETAFWPGMAKATYGTGTSVLVNTGANPAPARAGLASTVAWQIGDRVSYALEGVIHTTGAAIQWLRDELGLIADVPETCELARRVPDTGGVVFVPAFVGLGTPWWDPDARGLMIGLTRGTRREHIARAVLDSIALQVYDVFTAIEGVTTHPKNTLFCGGGGSRNLYLMQLQSDLLGRPVVTGETPEASALGATYLAGIASGLWTEDDLSNMHDRMVRCRYTPSMDPVSVERMVSQWHRAVHRSLKWELSSAVRGVDGDA